MPEQLELTTPRPAWLDHLRDGVRTWAKQGVYFGGSSWKYPGWLGQIYTRDRYATRGKFSEKKFDQECLAEYAEWFPQVCGDFAFYRFYEPPFWAKLFAQVPGEGKFRFGFKAPEALTSPVHQERGQTIGAGYLNTEIASAYFLERLAPYAKQIGYIIFEFPQDHTATPDSNRQFLEKLDAFLQKIPKVLPYSVEIRTPSLLGPDYFAVLKRHGVAHCFNSWTHMPSLAEQLQQPGCFTTNFAVARLLLRPGRKYAQAVKSFEPYKAIQDPYPEGYRDAANLIRAAQTQRLRATFMPTNNRYAGNAPQTVNEILNVLEKPSD